ncbi:MAG: hypothetical protein KDD69_06150 [Bdellovibrionales bacterium]|nr:hypothetical protein [Bdellovibrionales bacterium]
MKHMIGLVLLWLGICSGSAVAELRAAPYRFSGPYQFENLAIYLVHGDDRYERDNVITLAEALKEKKAVLHETGSVNSLSLENLTQDHVIFVAAGTIVKGGQQDRVLSKDLVVLPGSGTVSIDAFCVEQGRWNARDEEPVDRFSSAAKQLNARELKLAARKEKEQGKVWAEVAAVQEKLNSALNARVRSTKSSTSLQLTLEHQALVTKIQSYQRALGQRAQEQEDAIGYVFAINGELNSGDVFASRALFLKLWPTLLEAAATEAAAETSAQRAASLPTLDEVTQFIRMAETAPITDRSHLGATETSTRETDQAVVFESNAETIGAIRKSFIKKKLPE